MKRALFTSIYLFLIANVSGQSSDSIVIKGQILPVASKFISPKVSLLPYNADDPYYFAAINPDGTFSLKIPIKTPHLYDVKYGGYSKYILLTPAEPSITYLIEADGDKVRLMKATGSTENKAYFEFRQAGNSLEDGLKGFRENVSNNSDGYTNKVANGINTFNKAMEALRQQYPSTYTATVLSKVATLPQIDRTKPLLEQVQQHFFDGVDWTNFLLYNTPDLDRKMTFYLENIADTSAAGELAFINTLYAAVKREPVPRQQLTNLMFTQLVNNLREDYLHTYITWALAQPFIMDAMPVLAAKIKLVANVLPGAKAADVTGADVNGITQSLYSSVKGHKLTMLLFWESGCSHCRQSMPEFKRVYNKYHDAGFEVFAASMDVDTAHWKQFISKNDLKWVNILLPSPSNAHSDYYIQYTPTMVLIDGNGTIIRRFIEVEELDKAIAKFMGD